MRPSEVRTRILGEHIELRSVLGAVDDLARRVAIGDTAAVETLRERALELHDMFASHLDLEDRILIPAIRKADSWGPERADQLAAEHREQREFLQYMLARICDTNRPTILLSRELRNFVECILDDMVHEEKTILDADLLRDDVVGIRVETG